MSALTGRKRNCDVLDESKREIVEEGGENYFSNQYTKKFLRTRKINFWNWQL